MNIQGDYSIHVNFPFAPDEDAGKYVPRTAPSKDQHLVDAAQAGCRTAFTELWDLYSRRVYRTLLGITHNPQDAEDALQDTFLRAFLAIDRFESRANFYTWLTRIAINSALGTLRRRRCRPESSFELNLERDDEGATKEFRDLAPDPEEIYSEREEREKLMQAIQRLPSELRKATQVRINGNCSVKELACRLSISEAAAKSRLYRARVMLESLTAVSREPKGRVALS